MPRNEWPTPAEMTVMRILQGRPRGAYGLEIVVASENAVKRGSVYVLLGRLSEKGFVRIVGTKSPAYEGPPRPQYALTLEGSRVMAAAEEIGMSFVRLRA